MIYRMIQSVIAALVAALSLAVSRPAVLRAQSDLETKVSVALLVDISKSFAPLTANDQKALDQLERAIERKATQGDWEPPISIYWASIGSSGVMANTSVCGSALFHPRMVNPRAKSEEFSSITQLQTWFKECIRGVVSRSQQRPEPFTDISGSVALAAEAGKHVNGRKLIAILSDFAEDRPAGTKPTEFQLSGETVVMLYRAQPTDATDGNLLFTRLKQWEDRFTRAGAKKACTVSIVGATSNTIASCF